MRFGLGAAFLRAVRFTFLRSAVSVIAFVFAILLKNSLFHSFIVLRSRILCVVLSSFQSTIQTRSNCANFSINFFTPNR